VVGRDRLRLLRESHGRSGHLFELLRVRVVPVFAQHLRPDAHKLRADVEATRLQRRIARESHRLVYLPRRFTELREPPPSFGVRALRGGVDARLAVLKDFSRAGAYGWRGVSGAPTAPAHPANRKKRPRHPLRDYMLTLDRPGRPRSTGGLESGSFMRVAQAQPR